MGRSSLYAWSRTLSLLELELRRRRVFVIWFRGLPPAPASVARRTPPPLLSLLPFPLPAFPPSIPPASFLLPSSSSSQPASLWPPFVPRRPLPSRPLLAVRSTSTLPDPFSPHPVFTILNNPCPRDLTSLRRNLLFISQPTRACLSRALPLNRVFFFQKCPVLVPVPAVLATPFTACFLAPSSCLVVPASASPRLLLF